MRRVVLLVSMVLLLSIGCSETDVTPSSFNVAIDKDAGVNLIAISPNGNYIALGGSSSVSIIERDTQVTLWTAKGEITAIGFSPSEELFAASTSDTAAVWDVKSGKLLYEIPDCSSATVTSLALSASDEVACGSGTGDLSGTLKVWNLVTSELSASGYTKHGPLGDIIWSPDQATIAAISFKQTIALLDAETGKVSSELNLYDVIAPQEVVYISDIAFNPSGDLIAAGYTNGMLGIWDTKTGELATQMQSETGAISRLVWSHDGNIIAAGTKGGSLFIWNSTSYKLVRTLEGRQGTVSSLAFTVDDKKLVSAFNDGQIVTYSAEP